MTCKAKHTKYQPTDEEWRCPKCGANSDKFYIDEGAPDSSEECELLHDGDVAYCLNCEQGWMGKTFAAGIQKKHNLVPCQHCKGTGLVKGDKA